MNEYDIPRDMMERFNNSALMEADLDYIEAARPLRPHRYNDYIWAQHWKNPVHDLWRSFKPVIPLALIDSRITDLAKAFGDDPDKNLITGYRRLEDIFRQRLESAKHGSKLFSEAFFNKEKILYWQGLDEGEQKGRASLFTGVFLAHRNPRAHREIDASLENQISEFLLLNHLFRLELTASIKFLSNEDNNLSQNP